MGGVRSRVQRRRAHAAGRRLGGGVPERPERAVYNNALLDRDLGPTERAAAVDAMEAAYNPAGLPACSAAPTRARFTSLIARPAGETVATAIAFDHDGDCGVFEMSTLEAARRRGLGTALTAGHVHDAVERGCSSASLQSTAMAERVYAAVGFRTSAARIQVPRPHSEPVG